MEVYVDSFITLGQGEGAWSTLCPGWINPEDVATGTFLIGGWVDSWAGIDALEKTEIPCAYVIRKKKILDRWSHNQSLY